MNYGFVKVAAAVPHVKVADCFYNIQQIEGLMRQASQKEVQIIAFPELSVTSYTCMEDLKEITKYYKKEVSINMAHKKVKDLKHYADLLADNPLLGFYEQALSSEPQGFRSLVHEHYKIIYFIEDDIIYISAIFDCRQNPDKLRTSIR